MPESFSPTLSDIRKVLKPVNAWWVVLVVDPIAMRVLWLLVRIWPKLKPTTATVASLLVGVASAYLFSLGKPFFVLAAVVFQVSFLLVCIDGRLARLRDWLVVQERSLTGSSTLLCSAQTSLG